MLSKAEERIIKILWKRKSAYMKEIMEALPSPKPAKTTVSTLLKRMIDKKMVTYEQRGNVREYFPLVDHKSYSKSRVNELIQQFFNSSATQFASFFTKDQNLSISELEEIRKMIDQEIDKKKND